MEWDEAVTNYDAQCLIQEEVDAGNNYFCGATGEFHNFTGEVCGACFRLDSSEVVPQVMAYLKFEPVEKDD